VSSPDGPVLYQREGSTALVIINRPERRNAIDVATAEGLLAAYERFEHDSDAAVLVIAGQGDEAFCAGLDLHEMAPMAERLQLPGGPIGFARHTATKPTVAAVSGWSIGAGMDLALWCDIRVASSTATFGFFERRWRVPSTDGYSQRLPRLIGLAPALDMMLTGRPVDAAEALAFHLVSQVVEAGDHVERALAIAERIASYPQAGLLATRRAAHEGLGLPLEEGLALEAALAAEAITSSPPDAQAFSAAERGRRG
jgi:enoyl-CoA hydratase